MDSVDLFIGLQRLMRTEDECGQCVSDEELPTPNSSPQPPEQSFLTARGQWQAVGLMVGGTQAPKIPVWCKTLLMGGTSE